MFAEVLLQESLRIQDLKPPPLCQSHLEVPVSNTMQSLGIVLPDITQSLLYGRPRWAELEHGNVLVFARGAEGLGHLRQTCALLIGKITLDASQVMPEVLRKRAQMMERRLGKSSCQSHDTSATPTT